MTALGLLFIHVNSCLSNGWQTTENVNSGTRLEILLLTMVENISLSLFDLRQNEYLAFVHYIRFQADFMNKHIKPFFFFFNTVDLMKLQHYCIFFLSNLQLSISIHTSLPWDYIPTMLLSAGGLWPHLQRYPMLELLMTSHGSSESCGFKQGTGCSRGLRAIAPQMQEVRKYRPPWEERKKERKRSTVR